MPSVINRDIFKSTPSLTFHNTQIENGNKIILGSKPNELKKPKTQLKKNVDVQVKVIISDIAPYLERSNKYCKECLTLYPNKFKLDAHMKSSHLEKMCRPSLMNVKRKSKLNNCNIRHILFSSRDDLERHYKTNHKRHTSYFLKTFMKTTNMPLKENSKINSKHLCSHCKKTFPSKSAVIGHMYEIFNTKKNKGKIDNSSNKNAESIGNSPVNQKTIKAFRCPFCSYYFSKPKYYFCHILKKHNMTRISSIKKEPVKLSCKHCGLNFSNIKSYNTHISNSHQELKDLKINDIKETLNPKNKNNTSNNTVVLLDKSYACKSTLFKCSLCDVHFLSANTAIKHLSHLEILIHWKCNICQRIFKKNDEYSHTIQHNYSDEFTVYNLDNTADLKVLFKCLQCAVHFTEENYYFHSSLCGTIQSLSTYCIVCNILIDKATIENHKHSHDYNNFQKDDYIIIDPDCAIGNNNEIDTALSAVSTTPHRNHKSQSENLMVQDLQCVMPNVLFLCKNCNYVGDTYDKTVHHCQEHCQNNKEIITLECNICCFRFTADEYDKHRRLHEKKQWNATMVKIFNYDNAYFLSENEIWIRHIFGSLSNKELIKEHTQKSVYRYEHRLKLHISQEGPIQLTVYKCEKCCRFIDPISLFKHLDACSLKLRRHPCSICGLPFISYTSRNNHEKIHETTDVGLKSYRIISFNTVEDANFNKNIIASYNQHVLFQCRMCNVVINKGEVEKHKSKCRNCDIKKCCICGLLIYQSDYETHISKHKDLKCFNENSIKIILFGKTNDKICKFREQLRSSFRGLIIDYTFYKCSNCAVCFGDVQSKLEHFCNFSVPYSKCPKCPIYLYTINLQEHLKMHERKIEFRQENFNILKFDIIKPSDLLLNQDPKLRKSPVVVIKREINRVISKKISPGNNTTESEKKILVNSEDDDSLRNAIESSKKDHNLTTNVEKKIDLFKCFCGLHFLDNNAAIKHVANCNSKFKICKQTCSKCGLLFSPNELFTHVLNHHGNKFITYKYNVIDI